MVLVFLITLFVFVFPTFAQPYAQDETFKLLASDGEEDDRFGIKVSLSGDNAVIGAYRDDDGGTNSGAAYIYHFDGTSWTEATKLLASDGAPNDTFGISVFISGDTAIIGAPCNDSNAEDSGAAYIFRFNGKEWQEEAKVIPQDGGASDNFGIRVSIFGDTAIVGANLDDDSGFNAGAAYIFRFNGSAWEEETKLLASDGTTGDSFGRAVSINNTIAVVGSRLDDDLGNASGSAYIFRMNGNNWEEETKLLASDGSSLDNFGHCVSMSDNAVLVGARQGGTNSSGAAYLFNYDGENWIEETALQPNESSYLDEFGHSVSISGDTAVIGAGGDDTNGNNSGNAYIFRKVGGSWIESTIKPSDGLEGDNFGLTVSLSGNTALVGSRFADENGNDAGGAYIFNVGNFWTVDDDGAADFDNIQSAVNAANDDDIVVVMQGIYTSTSYYDPVVNLHGKQITLQSVNPHDSDVVAATKFSGEGTTRVIECTTGETNHTVISGITIYNGFNEENGGGMYCLNSSPSITRCVFDSNLANAGAGMDVIQSSPTLIYCSFVNNKAIALVYPAEGGGMRNSSNSNPSLVRCTFESNSTTEKGSGGAIYNTVSSAPLLDNCRLSNNHADFGGGMYNNSGPILLNTTVCENSPDQIYGNFIDSGGNHIADDCSIPCPDLNGDSNVNVNDLLVVIDSWGTSGGIADINEDGTVNISDLLILISSWGPC